MVGHKGQERTSWMPYHCKVKAAIDPLRKLGKVELSEDG